MRYLKSYTVLLLLLVCCTVSAGKVKKGFRALEIYNYFEAKRLFEKSVKHNIVASCYGLSIIYQRTDNPFFNIDSAYSNIVRSVKYFPTLKLKKRLKYKEWGVDSLNIIHQRDLISDILYIRSRTIHTIAGYNQFITRNSWSNYLDSAKYLRDKLAFDMADFEGTSDLYDQFLINYPDSYFTSEANSKYWKSLYTENTSSNSFTSYLEFINQYPNSPYRPDAEDRLFEIYTSTGSVISYRNFI